LIVADLEKLKALANEAIADQCWEPLLGLTGAETEFAKAASPDAVLELIAELKELRRRADYWRQRAKSAEGHLYAGDMKAAMRELHKRTAYAGTPWEDLSVSRQAQIQGAAVAVVGAINSQRDRRLPADSQETAHD
jgi:hypothetical protein